MKSDRYFPYDNGTLDIIKELESILGLQNKECDKMGYINIIEYIDKLVSIVIFI